MLRSDARVVEPGGYRVRFEDLAVLVLHEVALHAVHDAGDAVADGGAARRLDADEVGRGVDEAGEEPDRVRPTADAGDDDVGIPAEPLPALLRASSPMTRWNSRTIHGYGCGPITEPRQ